MRQNDPTITLPSLAFLLAETHRLAAIQTRIEQELSLITPNNAASRVAYCKALGELARSTADNLKTTLRNTLLDTSQKNCIELTTHDYKDVSKNSPA